MLVQLPQHLMVLERLRDRLLDHLAHPRLVQAGIEAADVGHDRGDGVGAVVGTAAGATWLAVLEAMIEADMAVGKPAWKPMWVISVAISPRVTPLSRARQLSRKLVGPGRGLLRRRALPSCGPAGRGPGYPDVAVRGLVDQFGQLRR